MVHEMRDLPAESQRMRTSGITRVEFPLGYVHGHNENSGRERFPMEH